MVLGFGTETKNVPMEHANDFAEALLKSTYAVAKSTLLHDGRQQLDTDNAKSETLLRASVSVLTAQLNAPDAALELFHCPHVPRGSNMQHMGSPSGVLGYGNPYAETLLISCTSLHIVMAVQVALGIT
jgi:hypothetical protein